MAVFNEARHAGEFILSEASGKRSRENVVIGAEQEIAAGSLLAFLAVGEGLRIVVAADDDNTGDGELTLAEPAVNSKVKHGVYTAVCIAQDTDSGVFRVEDPNGNHIGDATVGVAFNKEIKFTIADGDADFVVGDKFTITVIAEHPSDFEAVAFDPTDTDGAETAAAIAIYPVTTGEEETAKIAAIVRDAEVNGKVLVWPEGITAAQKEAAIADLQAVGIIVR